MSTVTRRDRADAIRFLSMDAVQKANSGHPGMPMGMADIAEVLWHDFLRHSPAHPEWLNRDRFVLSNGHGCMLLYALLHLTGYELTLDDLKQFRQLHSKTPGHPEWGHTPGVETTTGPLGQGIANAVGMAMAEKHLAATFNREGFPIIDHYTYCFVGDGDLMEGISHEVCSLAGVFGLGKLIVFYDDNGISIDGEVSGWFRDQTSLRFQAYGWHVIPLVDGHDSEAIHQAILDAQSVIDRPTIICCQSTIGWGAPNLAGSADTHGAALGEKEIASTRDQLNWAHEPFVIPDPIYDSWRAIHEGEKREGEWKALFKQYELSHPDLAKALLRRKTHQLPSTWKAQTDALIKTFSEEKQPLSTRKASQRTLDHYANALPEIMGGSADLTESNCTNWKGMQVFSATSPAGRYIHYGVREFGMSAIMNGLALYGGVIPFGGTFLTFSDYARHAIRLASLMKLRVIFVYTHDSIGLGEDGPTHQPIEHLPSLRLIPGLSVWRPCDLVETAVAWRFAIEREGPTCLLFSRQNLPSQSHPADQLTLIERGGYILLGDQHHQPDAILIASGSEVSLAMDAAKLLESKGLNIRVVSLPAMDVFLSQDSAYQEAVLPSSIKARVMVEAAASSAYQLVGEQGAILGLNRFGASAPAKDVFRECGFTVERVVSLTEQVIQAIKQK